MILFRTFFKGIANVKVKKVMAALVMFFGVLLSLYPFLSNFLYERSARAQIEYVREEAKQLKTETREAYLRQADAYNAGLADTKICFQDPFTGKNSAEDKENDYEALASSSILGLMGILEIPCIGAELPVYYGTSEDILQKGVGHLEGSSIPTGRKGTHAVLTGHTGLNKARLFTDLHLLQAGNIFRVHVLDEVLTYQVYQVEVVEPDDSTSLHIRKGEDLVTLITCTPYGKNTHRLLVHGRRITERGDAPIEEPTVEQGLTWEDYTGIAAACITVIFILLLLGRLLKGFVKRKKTHEKSD